MKIPRLRSIAGLILLAFGLAIVPLVAALVGATFYVDRVTQQGQRAIAEATRGANATQKLTEAVTAMERNARQYQVLGDRELYRYYLNWREAYLEAMATLQALHLNASLTADVLTLAAMELEVHQAIEGLPAAAERRPLERFGDISQLARRIEARSTELVQRATAELQRSASRAKDVVLWQTAAILPLVLVITVLLIVTIIRPIRQLDGAIRRLGRGDFARPVTVAGISDIEELAGNLERMRRRIVQLEDQKITFLRHMSHELKTPLASIREGSSLLSEEAVGELSEEQREIAVLLDENARQLQRQIEDLLTFSMAQDREETLHLQQLDLAAKVDKVLRDHRMRIKGKGLKLETRLESVTVQGDAEKLRAVIDNLVSNAVKFSPEGGVLALKLERRGSWAVLEITDQGPGIPREERDRVFEAFFQGRAQHREPVKGTGLGLAIARAYATLHGGSIDIPESVNGTRVRLELPLAPQAGS